MKPSTIQACARAAHEANRAYCLALGDTSHLPWADSPDWVKASALAGVEKVVVLGYMPEQLHASWTLDKVSNGWSYGPVKSGESRTHPCLVAYEQLPPEQRAKDELYRSVVLAVAKALGHDVTKESR